MYFELELAELTDCFLDCCLVKADANASARRTLTSRGMETWDVSSMELREFNFFIHRTLARE